MTLPGNSENQPKAETREQLVRYWGNSLDKLQEEDDAVLAGYILGDIVDTEFWEEECHHELVSESTLATSYPFQIKVYLSVLNFQRAES